MAGAMKTRIRDIVETGMNRLKDASSLLIFLLMVGLILLLGANIILRYFFNTPIAWANTISRYAYIFIVLVGSGIAYIEEGHARIDLFYYRVGSKIRVASDLCHYIIMIVVCMALIVMGLKHSMAMWSVHAPIIPWFPVGVVYLSIPLCAVLILFYLIKKMLEL